MVITGSVIPDTENSIYDSLKCLYVKQSNYLLLTVSYKFNQSSL